MADDASVAYADAGFSTGESSRASWCVDLRCFSVFFELIFGGPCVLLMMLTKTLLKKSPIIYKDTRWTMFCLSLPLIDRATAPGQ